MLMVYSVMADKEEFAEKSNNISRKELKMNLLLLQNMGKCHTVEH